MPDLKSFDRVAHLYDETRGVPPEAEQQIGDGIAALLREVAAAPRLLEVGIGTGRIAVPLAERGVRVTGIDISTKMLAILRGKRTDIDVMIAEASQPPLREHSFDGAIFVHILHLVPDAEATVRATIPLVRPGGVVIEAGDDWTENIRSRADALITTAVQELSDVDLNRENLHLDATSRTRGLSRGAYLFKGALAGYGVTARTERIATWTATVTAQRMLERLRRRDYSSSWKIPDEVMPKLLEVLPPRLSELFGGLETEVEFERTVSARVAKLPA